MLGVKTLILNMANDYENLKIREYSHWILYLHENQYPYIWRCYAWAKRDDAEMTTDMTREERDELFDIVIPDWYGAVKDCFGCDWPNVASMWNTSPHLHWHMIPRFRKKIIFEWVEFVDPNPNWNYSPYERRPVSTDTLMNIKEKIRSTNQ